MALSYTAVFILSPITRRIESGVKVPLEGKGKGKAKKRKKKSKAKKGASTAAIKTAASVSQVRETPARSLILTPAAVKNFQYVEQLFNNFTETNLHSLYSKKNPEKWFFDVEMQNYSCLLMALLSDESKIQRLLDFLIAHPKYKLKPSPCHLCQGDNVGLSIIFYLSITDIGRNFLSLLCAPLL